MGKLKDIFRKIFLSAWLSIFIWSLKLILPGYLAWFGIDFLKGSKHPVGEWLTKILESYFLGAVGLFIFGYCLDFIRNKYKNDEIKFLKNKIIDLKDANNKLEEEKENLKEELIYIAGNIKDQSNDILRNFAVEKLDSEKGDIMRISLYVKNKEFGLSCYSRYSKNQKYLEIKGKNYNRHGIVGKVWEEGNENGFGVFDNNIPEFGVSNNQKRKYIKYHEEKYNLDKGYIEGISMKSRLYYVYRIEFSGENLGVLLIESL